MRSGQDGAFYGDSMFRFDARGNGTVYDARVLDTAEGNAAQLPEIARFSMNPGDAVIPHCNAVVFGWDRFSPENEFPLLYANVYNNYAKEENRREGTCCVYRLVRTGAEFSLTLVQLIRVGFVHTPLWSSAGDTQDVRPYGNFVIDREKRLLHVDLTTLGEVGEAEWIDFRGGRCYCSDGHGKVFPVDFEL